MKKLILIAALLIAWTLSNAQINNNNLEPVWEKEGSISRSEPKRTTVDTRVDKDNSVRTYQGYDDMGVLDPNYDRRGRKRESDSKSNLEVILNDIDRTMKSKRPTTIIIKRR